MPKLKNCPAFRPPAEAHSLILQVDEGCPYNTCTFCGMYKQIPYVRRPLPDVLDLIARETARHPRARRVFLADGDVFSRPFSDLEAIGRSIAAGLPRLARINSYVTGRGLAGKTDSELAALRALKYHTLYLGLESGDEQVLQAVRKGETADQMVAEGLRAQAAGMRLAVMVLLGLGGREHSPRHIALTAAALNRLQPRQVAALRVIPVPGTALARQVASEQFDPVSERRAVEEVRELLAALEQTGSIFSANHSSNVIPLQGRLPGDRTGLLAEVDALLATGRLDPTGPGRQPRWL